MKKFIAILIPILIVIIILAAPFLHREQGQEARPVEGLPWQIEILPDGGSKVFGLTLDHSTLADAVDRLGNDLELAVIATLGEQGSLEAFYGHVTAGVLTGKMVLGTTLPDLTLEHLRERAVKVEYMDTGARKFIINADDLPIVRQAPITTITFIPSINLDEKIVIQRFGQPTERIQAHQYVEHFLYADKGLDLILNGKGKEILQYVAPRNFQRLREPLIRAAERSDNS